MSIQHTTRERSIELQGEIKRARDVVAECTQASHEKYAALVRAGEDLAAANERLSALEAEQKQLAQQAHDEVMGCEETAERAMLPRDGYPMLADNAKAASIANSELPEF